CRGAVAFTAARAGDGSGFVCGIAGGTQADEGRGLCRAAALGRRGELCGWRVRWRTTRRNDWILPGCALEAQAHRAHLGRVRFSTGARERHRAGDAGGGDQVGESAAGDTLYSVAGSCNPGRRAASLSRSRFPRVWRRITIAEDWRTVRG